MQTEMEEMLPPKLTKNHILMQKMQEIYLKIIAESSVDGVCFFDNKPFP